MAEKVFIHKEFTNYNVVCKQHIEKINNRLLKFAVRRYKQTDDLLKTHPVHKMLAQDWIKSDQPANG
jgi:hypothetical protein